MNLDFLRPLYAERGPWVSVYLDAGRTDENAAHEVDLRWRALRGSLAADGADEATVAAVERAIRDHPYQPGPYGLAVFARAGTVALVETLPAPPPADLAVTGPLPHAMPLIAMRGADVPYVRVRADRTGGGVEAVDAGGVPRHRDVAGSETYPLRKVRVGGWSNRRYHQAAEEAWKRNAGDVARVAADLAAEVGAEVIVVGGDVRAVEKLVAQLPDRWRDRTVRTDANAEAALDDVTVQAVAETAERHVRETVDRFGTQAGENVAVTGLTEVVARLQRGQVETVLLADDPSSTDVLWIDPDDPTMVAVDDHVLRESGVPDPQRVRADAALLRAIAGTSAALVLVQPEDVKLEHGIGAVLRYADGSSAADQV